MSNNASQSPRYDSGMASSSRRSSQTPNPSGTRPGAPPSPRFPTTPHQFHTHPATPFRARHNRRGPLLTVQISTVNTNTAPANLAAARFASAQVTNPAPTNPIPSNPPPTALTLPAPTVRAFNALSAPERDAILSLCALRYQDTDEVKAARILAELARKDGELAGKRDVGK